MSIPATYSLTIGGSPLPSPATLFAQTLTLTADANQVTTLTCDIDSPNGAYVPTLDQHVALSENGTTIFGGTITDIVTAGAGGVPIANLRSRLTVTDYNGLASQRVVSEIVPSQSLKTTLQMIVTNYLATYGVSLDGAQVTGPTLPAFNWDLPVLATCLQNLIDATGGAYVWEIDATLTMRAYAIGSISAPFNIIDGDGHSVRDISVEVSRSTSQLPYANHVIVRGGTPAAPVTEDALNAGEIAAHGVWDIVIAAPTATTPATASALAAELLLEYVVSPQIVVYTTLQTGLKVGMTQTIQRTLRGINATFLITNISTTVEGERYLVHTVTAIQGSVYQGSWRDIYKQMSSGVSPITAIPGGTGTGGQPAAWYLGGSAVEAVQATGGTWVPIDGTAADPGVQVTLDTVARGTATAVWTVRVRAASGTVTARLRDLTNNLVIATTAALTGTTFQTVVTTVTLTAGANLYMVELSPSASATDIAGISFIQ